jgi:hypothetical protein
MVEVYSLFPSPCCIYTTSFRIVSHVLGVCLFPRRRAGIKAVVRETMLWWADTSLASVDPYIGDANTLAKIKRERLGC